MANRNGGSSSGQIVLGVIAGIFLFLLLIVGVVLATQMYDLNLVQKVQLVPVEAGEVGNDNHQMIVCIKTPGAGQQTIQDLQAQGNEIILSCDRPVTHKTHRGLWSEDHSYLSVISDSDATRVKEGSYAGPPLR